MQNYFIGLFCEAFAFLVRCKWAIQEWKEQAEAEANHDTTNTLPQVRRAQRTR